MVLRVRGPLDRCAFQIAAMVLELAFDDVALGAKGVLSICDVQV